MKRKTHDIAMTKGLHHQDGKYHSPHPEDIFVKTGPEQGLPINLNMLNHPKKMTVQGQHGQHMQLEPIIVDRFS